MSSEVAHEAECSANLALNLAPHDIARELDCQSTKEYVTDAGSVLAPFDPPLTVRLRIIICHKPELHLAVSLLRHSAWASPRDTRVASLVVASLVGFGLATAIAGHIRSLPTAAASDPSLLIVKTPHDPLPT